MRKCVRFQNSMQKFAVKSWSRISKVYCNVEMKGITKFKFPVITWNQLYFLVVSEWLSSFSLISANNTVYPFSDSILNTASTRRKLRWIFWSWEYLNFFPVCSSCPFLHRTAGDTERRYHLRYYKTCLCVYDTDGRGYCVKNGPHCAFAHGNHDLRPPVYDIKELQVNYSLLFETDWINDTYNR